MHRRSTALPHTGAEIGHGDKRGQASGCPTSALPAPPAGPLTCDPAARSRGRSARSRRAVQACAAAGNAILDRIAREGSELSEVLVGEVEGGGPGLPPLPSSSPTTCPRPGCRRFPRQHLVLGPAGGAAKPSVPQYPSPGSKSPTPVLAFRGGVTLALRHQKCACKQKKIPSPVVMGFQLSWWTNRQAVISPCIEG